MNAKPTRARLIMSWAALLALAALPAHAGSGTTLTASQDLKGIVQSLERNEEYLAAFAVSVERLASLVPPSTSDPDESLDALTDVVWMANAAGHQALADELARLLIKESADRLGNRDVRTGDAWRMYGAIARIPRGQRESWRALEEARCIFETAGMEQSSEYARLLWAKGSWYRWMDRATSLAFLEKGMMLGESIDPTPSKEAADRATWVGWTLLHLGYHDKARIQFDRAQRVYRSLGLTDVSTYGTLVAALGDLDAINEDWVRAERRYREATRIFELAWARRGATSRNIPLHGYHLMALTQVKQGKNDEAWRSLQRYRSGQAMRASIGVSSWRAGNDPAYQPVRKMYDQLVHNRSTAQALKESPFVREATWRALIDQLELVATCARAETDYVLSHPIAEASLEKLQSSLPENTAYVGWLDAWFGDDLSASTAKFRRARMRYVVRADGPVRWAPVFEVTTRDAHWAMRKPAQDFHAIMARSALWRERLQDDPELAALARRVYRDFFGDDVFELAGVERVITEVACLDEWIHTDALIGPDDTYLSERYAFSYSPSASVYLALNESQGPSHSAREATVLALGDPTFAKKPRNENSRIDEVTLRGALSHDPAALGRLPSLPFSGRELDHIQSLFPDSRILRGDNASEASINRLVDYGELDDFDIVHLASHALVDAAPERCAIALTRKGVDGSVANDGLIDTPEIRMGWKLNAELVTLSACQTAGVGFHRGEPLGFAQALFQAGTRCVLLSLWKVDDEATSMLMSRFYENVATFDAGKVSYSSALADAKNWLREYTDKKGRQPFAHPVYWSGFVLIGDSN